MWFEQLTGFKEINPINVRGNILLKEDKLISTINNKELQYGSLEIPSLLELQKKIVHIDLEESEIKVVEIIGNVKDIHLDKKNNGSLFQAASQFNLLEMISPAMTPEDGIDIYENDFTQGPACAIACGAGTIFRNYFIEINEQIGQSAQNQIDCLKDIGYLLENEKWNLWQMTNGYALPFLKGLDKINELVDIGGDGFRENLKQNLRIGIQWNTQVTLDDSDNIVTQVYCSALPVTYSSIESGKWECFASIILEATYEATLIAGLINYTKTGNNTVFLTLVGGGAFGNNISWIVESLKSALHKYSHFPLNIKIVSFSKSNSLVKKLEQEFS